MKSNVHRGISFLGLVHLHCGVIKAGGVGVAAADVDEVGQAGGTARGWVVVVAKRTGHVIGHQASLVVSAADGAEPDAIAVIIYIEAVCAITQTITVKEVVLYCPS